MRVVDFVQSCQNEPSVIYIYHSEDEWENDEPSEVFDRLDEITLRTRVLAWYMDANFALHILV